MKVTIHIEIGDYNHTSYRKEVISWMNELYPNLVTFDFDSHSESTIVNYAIDLLKQGEEIMVIIDKLSEGNSKLLLKFMDTLVRQQKKAALIIFNGEDELLDKMLKVFPENRILRNMTLSNQKKKIKEFFRLS